MFYKCCVSFCCTAKWISRTYTYISSCLDFLPIWVSTEHWVEFPVLSTRFTCVCSVAQSHLTLWPHGLQHARLPCLSPSPRVCSDSRLSSQWWHPTISSSVIPSSPSLACTPGACTGRHTGWLPLPLSSPLVGVAVKKPECRRIDAFELWCWRRLLRVPWTARRSNQSILKEINPGCSLEGMMLKLKL